MSIHEFTSLIARTCGAILLFFTLSEFAWGEVLVEHPELGFRLNLPDGFERLTENEDPNEVVRAYRMARQDERIAFLVERLHAALPRQDVDNIPAERRDQVIIERWGEFDLIAARVTDEVNGVPVLVFSILVPLKPEAIQIKLVGPASEEPRLKEILHEAIASLNGPTNWLTEAERSEKVVTGTRKLATAVGVVVLIIALLILMYKSSRRHKLTTDVEETDR